MSPIVHVTVSIRRLLARRPWLYWLLVGAVAAGFASEVAGRSDAVDAERARWGESRTVLVADRDVLPGDPLAVAVTKRTLPVAMIPIEAISEIDRQVARQRIAAGEVITAPDVAEQDGPRALLPEGWLAVAIVESPSSGARIGDRVQIASEGTLISSDAVVIGFVDDATLVAAPADEAPLLPAAAAAGGVALLLVP
jgi:hypothetical protein